MNTQREWLWSLKLVVAASLLAPSPGLAVEFLEYYKAGLSAVESRQWGQVEEMMEKAITIQPAAKARVKKSFFFRRYLPHFYLAKARFENGDCRGALASWDESERQGVVARFPEGQEIDEGREACRKRENLQASLGEALEIIEGAEASARLSRRRLSELSVSQSTTQTLLKRQAEAETSLGRARQRLGSGDITLDEVEAMAALAGVAGDEFEAVRRQAEGQRTAQVEQRQRQLADTLEEAEKSARRQLRASEFLQPYPPTVARRRSAVEQALERTRSAGGGDLSAGELQVLQSDLETATRNLRRTITPPPKDLRVAATAYLSRNYGEVLELLGSQKFDSGRAVSHSHLLQAAALFALYQASGALEQELLERAGDEVLACHRADPQRVPPVEVFSPKFVAFFDQRVVESSSEVGEPEGSAGI